MRRKAIVIGVNSYKDAAIANLRYAVSDASRLSGLLEHLPDGHGFESKFMADPTDSDVTEALEEGLSGLSEGDLFFFFFAGHGIEQRGTNQHLLLCHNAHKRILQTNATNGCVPHTFLKDLAKNSQADIIFCFDACRTSVENDREVAPQMRGSATLRDIAASPTKNKRGTCMTILSCSDGESAEENPDLGGGIFTFSLINEMKNCLHTRRSIIFNSDLMRSVATQMQRHRTYGTQTPAIHIPGGKELVIFNGTGAKTTFSKPTPQVEVPIPSIELESERIYHELKAAEERDQAQAEATRLAQERLAREKREAEEYKRWFGSSAGDRKVLTLKGMEYAFRWCPQGTFMMGSPSNEANRYNDETQHQVTLTKGFWMLETQVTQGQWESVMGSNPSHFKGNAWLPVEQVSWNDCQSFIGQLNELLRQAHPPTHVGGSQNPRNSTQRAPNVSWGVSLPTEAQWEYACRAGTTGPYGGTGVLADMGWYSKNSGSKPHPVGLKNPNAWGLFDMHGNVWEWCLDWCGTYPSGAVTDPVGASSGALRVFRGGSWYSYAWYCRSAYRDFDSPDNRDGDLGFRPCLISLVP